MGNIILNAQYTLITTKTPYVVPPYTGLLPVIAIGSTAVQSGNFVQAQIEDLWEIKEWLNIEQAVKKQILEAFPPGYVYRMRDLHRCFQNIQDQDLLAHTITQCLIDPFMILENKVRLKETWDASASFEDLVEHVFGVQEFVSEAGKTIDDWKIMTEVYTFIYLTWILTVDCDKWIERPNGDKKWADFQIHFTDVYRKKQRSQKKTEKQTGFHRENVVLMEKLERAKNYLINL